MHSVVKSSLIGVILVSLLCMCAVSKSSAQVTKSDELCQMLFREITSGGKIPGDELSAASTFLVTLEVAEENAR